MQFIGPGGLRLILALVVVLSHLSSFNVGRLAVVVFFILSGYWVSRSWLAGREGALAFAATRTLRIWPMFAIVCLAAWAGQLVLGSAHGPADLGGGLLLLGSASRGDMPIGVAWSLDLELQFYLCLPLLWLAAQRLPDWQLWLLGGLAWGLGIWLMDCGAWSFLFFLPAFAAGMWLAHTRWVPAAGPMLAAAGAFAASAIGLALWPEMRPLFIKSDGPPLVPEQLGHLALSLLLLPLVACVLARPSSPADRRLGDVSYALYLVHSPVITLLSHGLALGGLAFKLAALPAIGLVTLILYLWVDLPLETLRRRGLPGGAPSFAPLNSGRKHPN